MTGLRKNAFELLEKVPEDKLMLIIQIMQSIDGIYDNEEQERENAFNRLEKMCRKADHVDYEKELAAYREERYGNTDFG